MTKIVGIVAAVAMATSVFAADVAGKVALKGTLLKVDGGFTAISPIGDDTHNWAPSIALSVNGDVAGASFALKNHTGEAWAPGGEKANGPSLAGDPSIWFKPMDMLKFTVGGYDYNLFQETIDWSNSKTGMGGSGWKVDVASNGFELNVSLNTGFGSDWANQGWWFANSNIGKFAVKAAYGADFGTVGGFFNYAANDMLFGAGYKGAAGPAEFFLTGMGHMGASFDKVIVEAFVSANVAGLNLATFIQPTINLGGAAEVFMTAKVTKWGLGPVNAYLYLKDTNLLASAFAMEVKPGITGNVGAMGYELALDVNIGGSVTVAVPVSFNYGF